MALFFVSFSLCTFVFGSSFWRWPIGVAPNGSLSLRPENSLFLFLFLMHRTFGLLLSNFRFSLLLTNFTTLAVHFLVAKKFNACYLLPLGVKMVGPSSVSSIIDRPCHGRLYFTLFYFAFLCLSLFSLSLSLSLSLFLS